MAGRIGPRLRDDIVLTIACQGAVAASMFIQYWIVRKYWGTDAFGEFSLVYRVRGAIEWLVLLQLPLSIARMVSATKDGGERFRLCGSGMLVGIVMAVSCCAAMLLEPRLAARLLLGRPESAGWIPPLCALLMAYSTFLLVSGALRGLFEFRSANLINVVAIAIAPTAVLAVGRGAALDQVIVAGAGLSIASTLVGLSVSARHLAALREMRLRDFVPRLEAVRPLLAFGIPRLSTLVLSALFATVLPWTLAHRGDSANLGEVNLLLAVLAGAGLITAPAGFVLLPSFTAAVAYGRPGEAARQLRLLVSATLFAGVVAGALAASVLDFIAIAILGALPSGSGYLLVATAAAVPLYLVVDVLRGPLDAVSKFPLNAVVFALGFVVMLAIGLGVGPAGSWEPSTRCAVALVSGFAVAALAALGIAARLYHARILGPDEFAMGSLWAVSALVGAALVGPSSSLMIRDRCVYWIAAAASLGYALVRRPAWLALVLSRRGHAS